MYNTCDNCNILIISVENCWLSYYFDSWSHLPNYFVLYNHWVFFPWVFILGNVEFLFPFSKQSLRWHHRLRLACEYWFYISWLLWVLLCFKKKKPFLHVWVFHLHVCLYNTCMLGALKSGVGVNPLELELQMTLSWESNLSSPRELSVLWTTELSFQPVLCCSLESVLYLSIGLFGYLSSTFSCSLLHESFPSCFDLFCSQLRCECRTWVSVSSYYRTRFSIHFFFPIQLTYSVLQCYFFWSFFFWEI